MMLLTNAELYTDIQLSASHVFLYIIAVNSQMWGKYRNHLILTRGHCATMIVDSFDPLYSDGATMIVDNFDPLYSAGATMIEDRALTLCILMVLP